MLCLRFLKTSSSRISRKPTTALVLLGTSTPTKDLPGIGASMRSGCAAKARDKSLLKVVILDNFTPSAGLKVY